MKNRRIIFLAACMCSVVFLSGCSTDSLMDKMMGTETTVSSSASVDISKEAINKYALEKFGIVPETQEERDCVIADKCKTEISGKLGQHE